MSLGWAESVGRDSLGPVFKVTVLHQDSLEEEKEQV